MRGIKYEDIITEITFSEKGQKYTATRENNLLTLFSENSRIEFTLPSQHMSFLSFVFKYEIYWGLCMLIKTKDGHF